MSRRLDFLVALETGLKNINRANGYNEDVLEVSRVFRHWSETKNFIRINIMTGRETWKAQGHRLQGAVNFTDPFEFSLLSYIKLPMDTQDEGLASNIAEGHIADVKKYTYENPTLGLDWVREFVVESLDGFLDWTTRIMILDFAGHVSFQWAGNNP